MKRNISFAGFVICFLVSLVFHLIGEDASSIYWVIIAILNYQISREGEYE